MGSNLPVKESRDKILRNPFKMVLERTKERKKNVSETQFNKPLIRPQYGAGKGTEWQGN